ncbi:Golgin subfamily A member 7/ERF4 family protein [Malassezia restricta CBS 7877]|uniref:Ras modification protein ERF4 n=2 Tax=Malassezia restricta TaxID=76775 RepID=A0A3G2S704_MALR7|nr:Golgin subfamily A member 7/ERF4 family protein [Malassezia restricta CBS 7877]
MEELNATRSFDEEEATTGKGSASVVALSTVAQTRGSGADTECSVRIPRVFNGYETCEFSTHFPEQWSNYVDSLTYVSMIVALNETLRQAANPVYGLIDNILAQLTFQLWPFLMGTYYTR